MGRSRRPRYPVAVGLVPVLCFACSLGMSRARADEPRVRRPTDSPPNVEVSDADRRVIGYFTGAKFVGKFTDDANPDAELSTEQYTIRDCEKVAGKDAFRLIAKIKYGSTDGDFPIDVTIPVAGKTPVITLDSVWIPGLGTFSARVLVHRGRYAGTWQHNDHGGHLFGRVIPADSDARSAPGGRTKKSDSSDVGGGTEQDADQEAEQQPGRTRQ